MNVIESRGLGRRYGRTWALRDCTLAIPGGRVVALVGPNGAGKTTLLSLAVGLSMPSTGDIRVLDGLVPGSAQAMARVGFVAQDTPLYPNLSVADTLRLVTSLSGRFDSREARDRLAALGVPLRRRVGQLSGGQRAQVALTVALARHPDMLILDEPVARLDPLARHDFTAALMAAVAEDGLSVLLSSHVVAELERVCDYLVVLAAGRVQMIGDIDDLLAGHRVLTGPAAEADDIATSLRVVSMRRGDRQARMLARVNDTLSIPGGWEVQDTNVEELVLAYLRHPESTSLPGPTGGAILRRSA
jgi:ABC-2 type transport system ATP-binding protein